MRCFQVACLLLLGCDSNAPDPPAAPPQRSPNANVLPTPLAEKSEQLPAPEPSSMNSVPAASGSALPRKLPPPVVLKPVPLSAIHPPEADSEPPKLKDTPWLSLQAIWRWPNLETTALEPEADPKAIDEANKLLTPQIKVELHPSGRMRWQWAGPVFPLASGSELRARLSHYGHLLVWPGETHYRVLAPGTLRATLAERRVDATPLILGTVKPLTQGKRLGRPTSISELSTAHGTLILEQAHVEEVGAAGLLVCRTLVEMIAASPANPACVEGQLPLLAELRFAHGGVSSFEVTQITVKTEGAGRFSIPPPGAVFQTSGLPESSPILIDAPTQHALHSRDRGKMEGSKRGLVSHNPNPKLAYLILDRVRVALVNPFGAAHLDNLRPGRYQALWHSFFGAVLREPEFIDVPGKARSNAEDLTDAGPPPNSPQ